MIGDVSLSIDMGNVEAYFNSRCQYYDHIKYTNGDKELVVSASMNFNRDYVEVTLRTNIDDEEELKRAAVEISKLNTKISLVEGEIREKFCEDPPYSYPC